MSMLALIPARAGSKGIPRKNIGNLHGKPLVAWTIEAAQGASGVDRVVVTTEDPEIADISRSWGAEVPFLRPVELSGDDTPGIEPVIHAISLLPDFDWVLLLQPTSPLRTAQDIDAIVELVKGRNAPSAVSVCEASSNPYWTYLVDTSDHLTPLVSAPLPTRRQDLPAAYSLNGALYLAKRDWLLENRTFVTAETLGYVMPVERSVDIDSPLDWKWAEFLMKEQGHG
jgi:N-acylneuraminate cytidylyltransferase